MIFNNGNNIVKGARYLGHNKIDKIMNTCFHMFKGKLDNNVDTINKLNE